MRCGEGVAHPSLVCWRNIDVRVFFFLVRAGSEARWCFVGAQLEGIILVSACVLGCDAGVDGRVGWSAGAGHNSGGMCSSPTRATYIPS